MLIKDILLEDAFTNHLMQSILDSKYFELNIKPYFDKDDIYNIPSLYHGGKLKPYNIYKVNNRKGPVDSSLLIHSLVNKHATESSFHPIRNLLFSSRSSSMASEYGSLSVIIPLEEDYRLYYNKQIDDLYVSSKIFNHRKFIDNEGTEQIEKMLKSQKVSELISKVFSYYDTSNLEQNPSSILINNIVRDVISGTPFSLSTIKRRVNNHGVKNFKELYQTVTKDVIEQGVEYLVYLIGMIVPSVSRDINHTETLYEISHIISESIVEIYGEWIDDEASRYVDAIEYTQYIQDISTDREIMTTNGTYASLPIRGGIEELYKYYVNGH